MALSRRWGTRWLGQDGFISIGIRRWAMIFARRCSALRDLKVESADASEIDPDPETGAVTVALVSAKAETAMPARPDILVLAGPGDFPSGGDGLRLEREDIEQKSRRWQKLVDRLRAKLGSASLALTHDDLEVRLDEEARRADEAERARDLIERERDDIDRKAKRLESELVKARSRAHQSDEELERLREIHRLSAFALSSVSPNEQETVSLARDHAWRAQLAAQRALEMAGQHPEALVWKAASYSGWSENAAPSRFGAMTFTGRNGEMTASYRGEFHDGRREGHGVGISADGHVWTGQWKNDEACGFGVLETPDGRRFDGEVAPGDDGAPRRVRGWLWEPDGARVRSIEPHRAIPAALPSPQAAGG